MVKLTYLELWSLNPKAWFVRGYIQNKFITHGLKFCFVWIIHSFHQGLININQYVALVCKIMAHTHTHTWIISIQLR